MDWGLTKKSANLLHGLAFYNGLKSCRPMIVKPKRKKRFLFAFPFAFESEKEYPDAPDAHFVWSGPARFVW